MEDGTLAHPETGVVQGGVISPGLANVFLHHVLEVDAHKIMAVLPKRFARCGLTIHLTKTALVAFRQPEAPQGSDSGNGTS